MNIVVISAYRGQNRPILAHLMERIQREHAIRTFVLVEGDPKPKDWRRFFRFSFGKLLYLLESRLFYPGWYCTQERKIHECLFGNQPLPPLPENVVTIPASKLNDLSTVELLRELETDVLIGCGLPLLKPHIFQVPKIATLNVHLGLAPIYRGAHTVFWPLYKRDYENIGVTVHRIDAGIDTGPIVAHGLPALEPDDCEATLIAKLAILAGDALSAYLHHPTEILLEQKRPVPPGSQYNSRLRRIWHDLRLSWRRRFGGEKCPVLPNRTVYYFEPNVPTTASTTQPASCVGNKSPLHFSAYTVNQYFFGLICGGLI